MLASTGAEGTGVVLAAALALMLLGGGILVAGRAAVRKHRA